MARMIDPDLLLQFSGLGSCEWCGQYGPRHAHHLWSRGAGRLDVRINLIGLCPWCHFDVHNGKIARNDLLVVVANREKMLQDEIQIAIWELRRLNGNDA